MSGLSTARSDTGAIPSFPAAAGGSDLDETLVHLVGDSSKKVVGAVAQILKTRADLAGRIRPLLDSKKKPVRTAAMRILELMEDALPQEVQP